MKHAVYQAPREPSGILLSADDVNGVLMSLLVEWNEVRHELTNASLSHSYILHFRLTIVQPP